MAADHPDSRSFSTAAPPLVLDAAERRLNELGYKQELRRTMTIAKVVGVAFSSVTLFTGIIPLYGLSLSFLGPPGVVWGWVLVSFFTWFVALALAEICSSFPTTGSLYFWAAHLAGPRWGPFASWCCAWLELVGMITGIGTQAFAGTQILQNIILLSTGTNKDGGYLTPSWLFLIIYIVIILIWAALNTLTLDVVAGLGVLSIWWQVIGGILIVLLLPFKAPTTQPAAAVFLQFQKYPSFETVPSTAYALILSLIVSQYSLFGYDAAAHLTEETKGADINGPIAILYSLGTVSVLGWAVLLALTFSIQDPEYLFDPTNETAGKFVPAQILFDAFRGRHYGVFAVVFMLVIIWGSFFFGGLTATTSAARIMYAFARDGGVPYAKTWRRLRSGSKQPVNAVWLCCAIAALMGVPVLKLNVLFTAISSMCTIGFMGAYSVPLVARLMQPSGSLKRGPFHLGRVGKQVSGVALLWVGYTSAAFLLPTQYPIRLDNFNYAPAALGLIMSVSMLWWFLDARTWFRGPVRDLPPPSPALHSHGITVSYSDS